MTMKNLDYALKNLVVYPSAPTIKDVTNRWGGKALKLSDTFFYVLDGSFALTVNEHNYIVKKNQLAFLPKDCTCAHWKLPGINLKVLYFPIKVQCDGENLFEVFGCKSDTHVVTLPEEEVMDIFNRMEFPPGISDNVPHRMSWCSETIRLCAQFIQARIRLMDTKKEFDDVLTYMQAHFTEDIPLETLAEILHLNPSYFSTKFKESIGVSPTKYILQIRADKAASLLRDTDLPIAKIGANIGLSNTYYFRRFFEKIMGVSPEVYRKMFSLPPPLRSSTQ